MILQCTLQRKKLVIPIKNTYSFIVINFSIHTSNLSNINTMNAKRAVNFYKFLDFYVIEKEVRQPQWNDVKVRGKLLCDNRFENRTIERSND